MSIFRLAFDKSARRIDDDGRLHVERSHISKATINPYYGREIPDYESLGLQGDRVYKMLRDPAELKAGAATFARLPILSEHVPVTVDDPQPDLIVGAIGSNIQFNSPYLDADICVWDAKAIAGIETDKVRELSCAYRYVPVMEAGEFEGQKYDGRMTQIRGNHLALVEVGRAGSDVVVADANPFTPRINAMKMTKLGKALFAAFCATSPTLAADTALPALVGSATRKNTTKATLMPKLLAMDASIDSTKLDAVIDAILDVEQDPKPNEAPMAAADGTPAEQIKALLAGQVDDDLIAKVCALATPAAAAEDEFPDAKADKDKPEPGMKEKDVKAAMDASNKELRAQLLAAGDAAREVRQTIGDVIGMDSAAEIYGMALDHLKVDRTGIKDVAALRAMYKLAADKSAVSLPVVAQDSAGMAKRFKHAGRFGKAI